MNFEAWGNKNSTLQVVKWINGRAFELEFFHGDVERFDRETGMPLERVEVVCWTERKQFLLTEESVDALCELDSLYLLSF